MNDSQTGRTRSVASSSVAAAAEEAATGAAAVAAAAVVTTVITSTSVSFVETADGALSYDDDDYTSEAGMEKPFILEIGNTSSINNTTCVPSVACSNDYPLDMHLNASQPYPSFAASRLPQQHAQHPAQPAMTALPTNLTVYNNPYTHLQQSFPPEQLAASATAVKVIQNAFAAAAAAASTHTSYALPPSSSPSSVVIPQTVCTWPAATEAERHATPEVVPAPIYMSYASAREHLITKRPNPAWKEKALQIEKDYKKTACDRERTRMRDMNRAFDLLRSKLPISKPNGKKYSKIESLRIAINYISHLQQALRDDPSDLEMKSLSINPSKLLQRELKSNTAVNYAMGLNERRCRTSFHYQSPKNSCNQDLDKESDEQNYNIWSDNNYVPNKPDWEG